MKDVSWGVIHGEGTIVCKCDRCGKKEEHPFDNGQTTLFDQSGEGSGPIMDADYTVVDDPPALPAGTAALPAPQEEHEVAGLDSEEAVS